MRVTLDGPQILTWGMGGFRKSALIESWVFVPPTENLGDPMAACLTLSISDARQAGTRYQLTTETEKFYRAVKRAELGGLVLT